MSLSYNIKVCGAILAGGTASRIGGIAKGLIETAGGMSIIETLAEEMKKAGIDEVVLSAADAVTYESLAFAIVTDLCDRIGPIGGIEAILHYYSGKCDAVLLMPCDVPNITASQISTLIDRLISDDASVVIPRSGSGHFHPLCAVVRDGMAGKISDAIKTGERKVMNVWLANDASIADFEDASVFHNINTCADLKNWSAAKSSLADKVV